jgi:hypothetical protein
MALNFSSQSRGQVKKHGLYITEELLGLLRTRKDKHNDTIGK